MSLQDEIRVRLLAEGLDDEKVSRLSRELAALAEKHTPDLSVGAAVTEAIVSLEDRVLALPVKDRGDTEFFLNKLTNTYRVNLTTRNLPLVLAGMAFALDSVWELSTHPAERRNVVHVQAVIGLLSLHFNPRSAP